MNRKVFAIVLAVAFIVLSLSTVSFAADKAAATTTAAPKAAPVKTMPPKANFGMIAGTVVSIDNTDPANIKLQVKNDADGSVHNVLVTPWTNITKVTDVSEIKAGEPVRMMTRKVEDKDIAMGIMFGKMKTMPAPAPKAIPAPAATKAPQAPAASAKK